MTIRSATILGVLATLLAGCFSAQSNEYRFYVLDYVPETSKERLAKGPWQGTILVRNFPMGEAYQRPELVYRTSAHEIRYHRRDRWAVRTDHVVSDMVRKHLLASKLFGRVQNQYEEDQPDYELRGRVVSLEEYVTETARYAHLDMHLDFIRMSDNKTLWSQDFDVRREILGRTPVLTVRALSSLLEATMDRAIGAIDSTMSAMERAP
ncbi:MAG TPA: ABC-type transport auxiliary lipoprotein family protein [Fibrobacteria bacterium]|nr:ABC-type transport auxiliary lipoprotein family protein [Fibrobacteria bacterium]